MKKNRILSLFGTLVIGCIIMSCQTSRSDTGDSARPTPWDVNPRSKGISPAFILDVLDQIESTADLEIHSLMIAKDGEIIFKGFWEPYNEDSPHIVHSLTKLFTNAAAGIAVTEGDLSLESKVLDVYPQGLELALLAAGDEGGSNAAAYIASLPGRYPADYINALPPGWEANWIPYLKEMKLKHLLTMTSGHNRMISGSEWRPLATSWIEEFFKEPVIYEPGTAFMYCSANAYATSFLVQHVTGKTAEDVLMSSGLSRLNIKNFTWDKSPPPDSASSGGNGVTIRTEDMLKFGILYLNKGMWKGQRILSEDWCNKAIGYEKVDGTLGGSYAFHWVASRDGNMQKDGNFYSNGSYGQAVFLIPELNMVIASTAGTNKDIYPIIREYLIKPTIAAGANPGYSDVYDDMLKERAATLNLMELPIEATSTIAAGINNRTFTASENILNMRSIKFEVKDGEIDLTLTDDRGTHLIKNGTRAWYNGMDEKTTMTGNYLHHQYQNETEPYLAYAKWESNTRLRLVWRFPQMAFVDIVMIDFAVDGSTFSFTRSVNVNSQGLSIGPVTFTQN
jgi:CubicO group peptidase (beta-lactamase class C family)